MSNPSDIVQISVKDIWKGIWLDDNRPQGVAADFLRSLLPSKTSVRSTKGTHKVALVVGHNKKASGAYAKGLINQSEFTLNSKVAKRVAELADSHPEIEIQVFFRKSLSSYRAQILDVYRRVNKWSPKCALELHFDWQNKAGKRVMLHYPNSAKGLLLAKSCLKATEGLISGDTAIYTRSASDRGGLSLASCKAPCVMTELWDSSNGDHLSEVYKLGVEGLAQIKWKAIQDYLSL